MSSLSARRRLGAGIAAAALTAVMSAPAGAAIIVIDTDTGMIDGVGSGGSFNGTTFTTQTMGGVMQFLFHGDLSINAGDTVVGVGNRGASLYAGNNANIGAGVTFNFNAVGTMAGAGGGGAGGSGSGGSGGTGSSGGSGGSTAGLTSDGGAGGNATCDNRVLGVCTLITVRNGSAGRDGAAGGSSSQGGASAAGGTGSAGGDGVNNTGGGTGGSGGAARSGPSGVSGAAGGAGGSGGVRSGGTPIPGLPPVGTGDGQNGEGGGSGSSAFTQGRSGLGGITGVGGSGGQNLGAGLDISGGGGGGGGGGGSGGSGGSGGGGGGSGGGGGGGGSAAGIFEPLDGGGGGHGGGGADGGRGGNGGRGGDGAVGGAGGGAFEIVSNGRVIVGGGSALEARGGDSSGSTTASQAGRQLGSPSSFSGDAPTGGGTGQGTRPDFKAGDGGGGGSGGLGANGGVGGAGANGGGGGGGAGGTVKLYGTAVDASGASVNTSGGGGAGAGSAGRLILGSNVTGGGPGGVIGAGTSFTGPTGANPFIAGGVQTAFIADLAGGAELFGLLDGIDANGAGIRALLGATPSNAIGAVLRLDVGPTGYADDYVGYDMLLFVNLLDRALLDPMLGVDPNGTDGSFLTSLLEGGFANDALFGGSGDSILALLPAFGIYATLIPEVGTIFNASADGVEVSGATLADGDVAFLLTATSVPAPAAFALFGVGLIGLCVLHRRRNA